MSRFRLWGCTDSTSPPHIEECGTADAALGIGRRLAAQGLVVFAYLDRDDGHRQELALFVGNTMLPNRTLAPADNPLLAVATVGRAGPASGSARRAASGSGGRQRHRTG